MSWTEREGPPVSAPKRRGFGTIVMEAMAERSVKGKVGLDYAPSGVTWRLSCPAVNALRLRERERNSGERENRTDGATGRYSAAEIDARRQARAAAKAAKAQVEAVIKSVLPKPKRGRPKKKPVDGAT
jgi:hypothetical protein